MFDDAALRERALRVLGVMDLRHKPGGQPHNQQDHAGGGVPNVLNVLDKLRLAGRIQLGPGEKLLSSRKFRTRTDSDSMDFVAAEIHTPQGRQIRFGVVAFAKNWAAGPDPETAKRKAELNKQIEALEDGPELFGEDLDHLEALREELDSLGSHYETRYDRTVTLAPDAVAEMRTDIEAGVAEARQLEKDFEKFWDDHSGDEEFGDTEITHAEGILAGGPEGDLAYEVTSDDEARWNVRIGIKPPDAEPNWYIGSIADDEVVIGPGQLKAFLKDLAELSGDQSGARSLHVPRARLREVVARLDKRHTPGGQPHNQQDHAGGGAVGLAKKAAKAITPEFKLPEGISRQDYDRLVRIRRHGSDATEADDAWADSLDWPNWVTERAEGEGWLLTKEKWYRESLPGDLKNMPVEELRERMAEHLRETWAGKPIAVRVFGDDLAAILKDGRFKTQFESGKAGREASFMPAQRKDLEAALHGIPHDADPSKRPVYGYVSVDPDTPWMDKQLNKFGPVAVMLKDSVRARTTATVGDSANEDYSVWPSPVDNPSSVSANPVIVRNSIRRFPTALDDGRGRDTSHPEFRANEYIEAQIHSGVTVDDIAEVVFLEPPSDVLKDQLKRAGLSWKVSVPPAGSAADRAASLRDVVAREVQALLRSDVDDDPIGELDDDTLILLQAMAELDEEAGVQARAWNPALHPRWPKGHPKAGQFRTMIDQLKAAIKAFDPKKDKHPFENFKRPQLLKAAKARGISLRRGEDQDSIAAKLLADLKGSAGSPAAAPSPKSKTAAKVGTSTGRRKSVNQKAIDAAKDVASNPNAHATAVRLDAYDGLTKADFDSLDAQSRNDIIADLSGIHNASTGFTGQTAFDLINRFTPPGTPPGGMANAPVIPPAAKATKRAASKAGTPGLLKRATDQGLSGDGWFYPPGGGKAVWGKYGAAGLLLHNRGSDGVDRYLMVQRGPAISDPGKWQFPGGAIDSKETPFQGATREVLEELGFKDADLAPGLVHGTHEVSVAGGWKYTSIAASVPTRLKPDLSTHHARAETSDAKWMTVDEIRKLDSDGKLLAPLAGGKLEKNVLSLFPPSTGAKAPRKPKTPPIPTHKPSTGKNLIANAAAQDKLRADVAAVRKNYRGKTADERLAAIGEMQGYNATPTVVSKSDMDRLLATGDYIEVWRGVKSKAGKSAASINEDMRSGPAYYGLGVFGNGYYLASDKKIAERYTDGSKNSLLRILIPKKAKTDKHDRIVAKARAATSSTSYYHQGRQNMGGGTLHDEGRYAAAAGLDGIEISVRDYRNGGGYGQHATAPVYNWVNRSVLIIEEAQR